VGACRQHPGRRQTLTADAVIPAVMALVFLGLLIYFRSIGGYKAVHLQGTEAPRTNVTSTA
jgi:hypothetical protein